MKDLYSIPEAYIILYNGIRSLKYMRKAKKNKELSEKFSERIMLAVTEVNKCEMCSYAHTKMALESGMTDEEIKKILCGECEDIPTEELPAILFAQHYADSKCRPSQEAWEKIVNTYGETKANGILATIRIITIGNTFGIPLGSFTNRFKGKADKRSNIFYEIGMIFAMLLFPPFVIIHSILANLFKARIISF